MKIVQKYKNPSGCQNWSLGYILHSMYSRTIFTPGYIFKISNLWKTFSARTSHQNTDPFLILPFYWKLIKTFALKKLRLDILILLFIFRNQREDILGIMIMKHDIKVQALRNVCYVTITPDLFQTLVWIQLHCNNYVGNLTDNWNKCSLLEEHHHNW